MKQDDYFKAKDGKRYIKLGVCGKPHGIRGDFSLHLYNSEESVLKKNQKVLLIPESNESSLEQEGEYFQIQNLKFGNKTILSLKNVNGSLL